MVRLRRVGRQELRVESFELVEVGPGLGLVRVAGEWRSGVPSGVRLVALHGGVAEELPALPEPPGDGGGLWRAAFSAEGDLRGARFRLHTDDGRSVRLPAPVSPRLRPEVAPEPEPEPVVVASVPSSAEEALRAERRRAERTEASLREQLRVMVNETAEFLTRLEGYELRRAELEKELSWERLVHKETRRLLVEAESERDALDARAEDASATRRQLASARERVAELERAVEERDQALELVRRGVDRGERRLAGLEERLLELRGAASASPSGPALGPEELDRFTARADRGIGQLAALERRLTVLRERV